MIVLTSVLPVINDIEVKGKPQAFASNATNGIILFATDQGTIFSIDKKNVCKLQLNEFGRQGVSVGFLTILPATVWIIYSGRGLRRYSWQNDS
jgi:hypothetical protein